ncbi:MAG: hypothetical protein DRJ52_03725 [Thermoprotei archaeon]|nr:MAG: hypothetical protein DRJ52_03725 [Thermoprotei archaeon]HDI75114.1 class I SAM-dependent methyltransferase [Thermoprotei archaeon]
MSKHIAATKAAFEKISPIYDRLRRKPWTTIVRLIEAVYRPPLLDAGCGTGRHSTPFLEKGDVIAVDIAYNMVKILNSKTRHKNLHAVVADLSRLPLRDSCIGTAIYIASIHHLPKKQRTRALVELRRVLREKCYAVITAWSLLQLKLFAEALKQYVLSKLKIRHLVEDFGDVYIKWHTPSGPVYRFYHLYVPRELDREVEKIGLRIVGSYRFNPHRKLFENFVVLVVKSDEARASGEMKKRSSV